MSVLPKVVDKGSQNVSLMIKKVTLETNKTCFLQTHKCSRDLYKTELHDLKVQYKFLVYLH